MYLSRENVYFCAVLTIITILFIIFTIQVYRMPFPHLLSAAHNMFLMPNMVRAEFIYPDGSAALYNYHPYLSFLLYGGVTHLFDDVLVSVMVVAIISGLVFIAGYAVLYKLLRHLGYSVKESVIALIIVMSIGVPSQTVLYATGYDDFVVLFSTIFVWAVIEYEKHAGKRALWALYIISIIGLLTYWYMVPVILVYGVYHMIKAYNQHPQDKIKNVLRSPTFLYSVIMAGITVTQVAVIVWQSLLSQQMVTLAPSFMTGDFKLSDSLQRHLLSWQDIYPALRRIILRLNIVILLIIFLQTLGFIVYEKTKQPVNKPVKIAFLSTFLGLILFSIISAQHASITAHSAQIIVPIMAILVVLMNRNMCYYLKSVPYIKNVYVYGIVIISVTWVTMQLTLHIISLNSIQTAIAKIYTEYNPKGSHYFVVDSGPSLYFNIYAHYVLNWKTAPYKDIKKTHFKTIFIVYDKKNKNLILTDEQGNENTYFYDNKFEKAENVIRHILLLPYRPYVLLKSYL